MLSIIITGFITRLKKLMGITTSKLAASSYMIGLEQLGTAQTNSLLINSQVLAASGNSTFNVSVTAPSVKSIGLGKIKFSGLTSTNPSDVGAVWYPVQGTFSIIVKGAGVSDFFWLECYASRSGTTYTLNFEVANNSTTAAVTVPTFTLLLQADFYAYPF